MVATLPPIVHVSHDAGVGAVEEPGLGGRALEVGVDDAGADDGIPLEHVDLVDRVERLDVEHDAAVEATAPPRARRAGALGHDGGAGRLRVLEHRHDVVDVAGAHDGEVVRGRAERDRRVERVGPPHVGVGHLTGERCAGSRGTLTG